MTGTQTARVTRGRGNVVLKPYRILVASAGAASSLGAMRLASTLGRRRSASVHALAVATPIPGGMQTLMPPLPLVDDDCRRHALERLRAQLVTVRGARGWTMRATAGFAAESIVDAAERWPASLIVVGMTGSATAAKVARHSQIPVLVVPHDAIELPLHAIAAIDFTESSIQAAILAATMLGPNGTLTLLHASSLIRDESDPGSLPDLYTAGARDELLAIEDRVHRRTKRRVESVAISGEIVDELIRCAASGRYDMIALGSHEPAMLERILVGSVRARVLHSVGCSVLIAPAM